MEDKAFIQIEHVKKVYQMGEIEVTAIHDVSCEMNEGEFVVILGPSGSGKSTLLNILGGMDTPSDGKVYLEDDEITEYDEAQMTQYRRNKVGFVFQFYNLMSNLTAYENVELATEICQEPLDIDEVLASVSLTERSGHFPAQMSGGEQQRVAIARAVAKNPLLLLCDEPTGALDFKTGISILELLDEINRKYKKTIIVITHNASIANMADRVIKMVSGRVVENYLNETKISPERIEW